MKILGWLGHFFSDTNKASEAQEKQVMAGCGHLTYLSDEITVINPSGEEEKIMITISTMEPSYCHKCFEKMVIRCAWCGGYILPFDPITLYSLKKGFKAPEYAVVYKENPRQLVGCLRWDCADTGGVDRAGFWVFPGKVQRAISPIEEAFMTDKVVIVSDIGDIQQAKLI